MNPTAFSLLPQRHRVIWLGFPIFLAIVLLYAVHLLASRGTSNPWVNFPIFENSNASDVAMDWPLVAWIDWPVITEPIKVLIKNIETDLIQDLTGNLPCTPVGSDRGSLDLDGEWLVGSFTCNYPYSYEIHAFNLNTQELVMIPTPSGLPPEQTYASEPAIYGHYIIWQQEDWTVGRSDILLFNLQSRTVISLTQTLSPIIEVHPEIYQDWVVWNTLNLVSGDNFIALYNLSSSEQITIPLAFSSDTEVSLDSQYLVWTDFRNGSANADLYGYDLINHQEFALITAPANQSQAVIRDGIVAYREQGPPVSLYVYHLDTQETFSLFQPPPQTGLMRQKTIDHGVIVWVNSNSTNLGSIIYGAQQLPNRAFLPVLRQP